MSDIRLFQFSNYVRPKLKVNKARNWVLNGDKNKFYQYIIDRNNGSPTNASINNSYSDLIYGKGLAAKNASINLKDWTKLVTILKPEDLQAIIKDYQIFGECSFQIVKTKGKELSSINHVPKNMVVPSMENDEGLIESYWFCKDWTNTYKNEPLEYDAYGSGSKDEIYVVKPYIVGAEYFGQPDYLSGLMYAEMEEEIANLNISSIRNGLSAGYIVNVPGGFNWESEQKNKLENQIKAKLSGSSSASNFIINFAGQDLEITVIPFPTNENVHKQWESLNDTSTQKILTAHRCTSPSIVGIVSSSGFSNTADEMDTAEAQLIKRVIQPKQNQILNALQEVLVDNGINLELYFKPLTDEVSTPVSMSSHESPNADCLIQLGEDLDDSYEVISDERCDSITLRESDLNTFFKFASVPVTPRKNSDQDTSIFKIRYKYSGSNTGERDFCNKIINADKLYRAEDLDFNSNYNEDFAPKGKNSYNVFLFKGGVNCKHWWQRVILLKKDNGKISVNQARKMILELEPSERKDAMWEANDPRVAVTASPFNNWWSLDPTYRK